MVWRYELAEVCHQANKFRCIIGLLFLAGVGQKYHGDQILLSFVHSTNQCEGCGQNLLLILGHNKAELPVSDNNDPSKDREVSWDSQAPRRDDCAMSCLEVPQVVTEVSLANPCCFWQSCSFVLLSCSSLTSYWIPDIYTPLPVLDSQSKAWLQRLRLPTKLHFKCPIWEPAFC